MLVDTLSRMSQEAEMSQEAGSSQEDSARHFYDRISGVYDALSDSSEHEARELGLRLLDPSGDETVLEIGFGTGHALIDLAGRLSADGRVFGIDISPGMLAVAEKRVKDSGFTDRVALQVAGATDLPYDDDFFDVVFLSFTLELFPEEEIPLVLGEISRVLRPGGRLGVVSMHEDGRKTPIVSLYRFLHRHFPHIVDCQPIDTPTHLADAGFEILTSEGIEIWGLPVLAVVARPRS